MSYSVIACDMFGFADDPDHELEVPGFPTQETAVEYARRRLRYSLEEQREPGLSHEELRNRWHTFGEDCRVVGPEGVVYQASAELDDFIRNPATPEECDYLSLYESLLPEDFALMCEWAAGAMPPPHHYEYRITLGGYEQPRSMIGQGETPSHPRLQGQLTLWPDYPGPDVPSWTRSFSTGTREGLRVYTLLRDSHLLDADAAVGEGESSIGGETVVLDVTVRGLHRRIRSTDLPSERRALLLTDVMEAIRMTVPSYIWEELEARRRAYHLGRTTEG